MLPQGALSVDPFSTAITYVPPGTLHSAVYAHQIADTTAVRPAALPPGSPFSWLLEREVVRYLKIWQFTIAGHIMSALLFVLVFGLALANRIDGVSDVPTTASSSLACSARREQGSWRSRCR